MTPLLSFATQAFVRGTHARKRVWEKQNWAIYNTLDNDDEHVSLRRRGWVRA